MSSGREEEGVDGYVAETLFRDEEMEWAGVGSEKSVKVASRVSVIARDFSCYVAGYGERRSSQGDRRRTCSGVNTGSCVNGDGSCSGIASMWLRDE